MYFFSQLSTIVLPQESAYTDFCASKKEAQEELKKSVEENIKISQKRQAAAYARSINKKYEEVHYNSEDEILLPNMRKRERKGRRLQPDF